jgi:hypothetical protein
VVLLLHAQDQGDTATEAVLLSALREHFTTLEQAGLDAFDIGWIGALIDLIAGGDPAPFLELLPEVVARGSFRATSLRNETILRNVHGDPRFEAIVDDQLAQLAAVREITDAITLPGL